MLQSFNGDIDSVVHGYALKYVSVSSVFILYNVLIFPDLCYCAIYGFRRNGLITPPPIDEAARLR